MKKRIICLAINDSPQKKCLINCEVLEIGRRRRFNCKIEQTETSSESHVVPNYGKVLGNQEDQENSGIIYSKSSRDDARDNEHNE